MPRGANADSNLLRGLILSGAGRAMLAGTPRPAGPMPMRLSDTVKRLLGLASTIHRWGESMTTLDERRRERLAVYSERIADTLARAGEALAKLESEPGNRAALRAATRELGRIEGYVETIVRALRHHLDGRKLNGVKRRLEQLRHADTDEKPLGRGPRMQLDRLAAAEGYFRALADSLRA